MYGEEDEKRAHHVKSSITCKTKPDQLNIAEACPDKADINQVVEIVKHSKWVVLFLSNNQKWFEFWVAELLCCGVDDKDYNSQDICVLPLLYDVEPDTLPTFIRWLTYIEAKEGEDYVTRIFEIIKGKIE